MKRSIGLLFVMLTSLGGALQARGGGGGHGGGHSSHGGGHSRSGHGSGHHGYNHGGRGWHGGWGGGAWGVGFWCSAFLIAGVAASYNNQPIYTVNNTYYNTLDISQCKQTEHGLLCPCTVGDDDNKTTGWCKKK